MNNINYYAELGVFSNPGEYAMCYSQLPSAIQSLREYCSCFFLHARMACQEYIENFFTVLDGKNKRCINTFLGYRFSSNFEEAKDGNRPVGICRDSALLMCSILRTRKIPSRLRVGFASYYHDRFWFDGFVLEHYDNHSNQWNRTDVAINSEIISKFNLSNLNNIHNLSEKDFISASQAWLMVRQKQVNPVFFRSGKYFGLKIIRNRMIQDLYCLLKIEPLLWDLWGVMLSEVDHDFEMLDQLAELLSNYQDSHDLLMKFLISHPSLSISNLIYEDSPFYSSCWLNQDDYYASY